MKPDKAVLKRFKKLEREIPALRKAIFTRITGSKCIDPSPFTEWATKACYLLQQACGNSSTHYERFIRHQSDFRGYASSVELCIGVFKAAKCDFEDGHLDLKSLVSAEVIDSVIEQAQQLLDAKYVGPSCIVGGVALETTLKRLCDRKSIAHAKLDKMNADLAKAGVYGAGVQKQVTAWAHWRNDAAHGKWTTFTEHDVSDMIKGIRRFISDYL